MREIRREADRAAEDPAVAQEQIPILALEAAAVTAVFALAAYLLGAVGRGGALGGFLVGTLIYVCLDWRGFAILALFVAGGSTLTRIGYAAKRRAGNAEARQGRRGAHNALANCGVAVVCAVLAAITPFAGSFTAAFAAALGAAFADTAESEVGQLSRRAPRRITTFKTASPGTDGAISAPGTAAGVLAAGATALLAFALGILGGAAALIVWIAAFLGTVVDSLVGALAPRAGNELTNVICTLAAALLALLLV